MRNGILALFILSLMSACSIKEDRSVCPCRLYLDFSEVDTSSVGLIHVLATESGKVVFRDTLPAETLGSEYVREVPHAYLRINIWHGEDGRTDDNDGVVIPFGCECPPVFMQSFVADTHGEVFRKKVKLHKNYCKLTVKVEGVDENPYCLTFNGNVDGYDLDGQPSTGDFSCVAYPGGSGNSEALLPRQTDSSLLLDVDDGVAGVKTFAIGEYIVASGYDWRSVDLDDITVVLDYCLTYIRISIKEWDEEYVYNITL